MNIAIFAAFSLMIATPVIAVEEYFTLKDSRQIIGSYDAGSGILTIRRIYRGAEFIDVGARLHVSPDQIKSREPVENAPNASPMASVEHDEQRQQNHEQYLARVGQRNAEEHAARTAKEIDRAIQSTESRINKDVALMATLDARGSQLNEWLKSNQPLMQQRAANVESLRVKYNAAVDQSNRELAARGPRQLISSAMNPNGYWVGGPTDATQAMVNNLDNQLAAAQLDLNRADAGWQKGVAEAKGIAAAMPAMVNEIKDANIELGRLKGLAPALETPPKKVEESIIKTIPETPKSTGTVREKIKALALSLQLKKLTIVASDGHFLGNCDPDRYSEKSILSSMGPYGKEMGSFGESIWNKVGEYGSEVGMHSAANVVVLDPPSLIVDGVTIGKLTANKIIPNGISVPELISLVESTGR